jgi:hypothetical protein
MPPRYSRVRMEAKRRALDKIAARASAQPTSVTRNQSSGRLRRNPQRRWFSDCTAGKCLSPKGGGQSPSWGRQVRSERPAQARSHFAAFERRLGGVSRLIFRVNVRKPWSVRGSSAANAVFSTSSWCNAAEIVTNNYNVTSL